MEEKLIEDKAGEKYWTKVWAETELPKPIDVRSNNINQYPYKRIHSFYSELFKNYDTHGKTIFEIGCGNSVFLSYFAKEFGLKIAGIDYSELGCEQTKRILKRDGLTGDIYLGDAFAPDENLLGKFDFVVSLGVVEHFDDTSKAIAAFAKFVKPGGILITAIPNLAGMTGFLQKTWNKPVYDIHVPMNKEQLELAIEKAGLHLVLSKYFLSISFSVTLSGVDGKVIPYYSLKKFMYKILQSSAKVVWLLESIFGSLPERRLFSSGVLAAAQVKINNDYQPTNGFSSS